MKNLNTIKFLITQLKPGKFLYGDVYNYNYPHIKIKKYNKIKLIYYKYLIKFNLQNIKICICSIHTIEQNNNIILISKYKMKIREKIKRNNKYDLSYILYKIDLFDYQTLKFIYVCVIFFCLSFSLFFLLVLLPSFCLFSYVQLKKKKITHS